MSVEVPEQREPVIESRTDLFLSIVWFQFAVEMAQKVNELEQRVYDLENP